MAQAQVPGTSIPVIVIGAKGEISGTVTSSTGRRLEKVTMQLVNPAGTVIATTVTERNGEFRFPETEFGEYTLQCVSRKRVVGTSSVRLAAPTESVSMICAVDPGYWQRWGLLTALAGAAAVAGTAAVVTAGDPASPSQ